MKLIVKKLKTLEGRDGLMINCEIHYKGKQLFDVRDSGDGGELDVYVHPNTPENKLKHNELITYINGLPEYDFNESCRKAGFPNIPDEPNMMKWNLEDYMNDLIDAELQKKQEKKADGRFNRASKKSILVGKDKFAFAQYWWKNRSLAEMCTTPRGKEVVQRKVAVLEEQLKKDEVILNADYLRSIGIIVALAYIT